MSASASPWLVPDWPAPPRVHAIVTTREAPGVSTAAYARCNLGRNGGDDPARVARNREMVASVLALPAAPHWLHQVHGTRVLRLDAAASTDEPDADAAIANVAGVVLAILTADCLPVLLCADDGGEIAIAHAGWRGLAGGVLEATLDAMVTPAGRVMAWLGPCIGPASYEIDAPVRDAFVSHSADAQAAFSPTRPSHWHADLPQLARQRLTAAGVSMVHGGGFDTATDARFYSYRRDGAASGRFATLIWL